MSSHNSSSTLPSTFPYIPLGNQGEIFAAQKVRLSAAQTLRPDTQLFKCLTRFLNYFLPPFTVCTPCMFLFFFVPFVVWGASEFSTFFFLPPSSFFFVPTLFGVLLSTCPGINLRRRGKKETFTFFSPCVRRFSSSSLFHPKSFRLGSFHLMKQNGREDEPHGESIFISEGRGGQSNHKNSWHWKKSTGVNERFSLQFSWWWKITTEKEKSFPFFFLCVSKSPTKN